MTSAARDPVEEIDLLVQYIDCALRHPYPIPEGKHPYNPSLTTVPEVRDLYHCLYKLYNEESCSVNFREPVNALDLSIFNYYDVVKNPICLRTILDRIAGEKYYSNADQVMRDVDLIWENCRLFNGPQHALTQEAQKCAEALVRLRQSHEEEAPATEEQIDWLTNSVNSCQDNRLLDDITAYAEREDLLIVEDGTLDLASLKVKHIKALRVIVDRYVGKA